MLTDTIRQMFSALPPDAAQTLEAIGAVVVLAVAPQLLRLAAALLAWAFGGIR